MSRAALTLVCSLDVEEEGLFRSTYATRDVGVTNLSCLRRLEPLLEMGVRPTLFCAHPVLADDTAWGHVAALAERFDMEIAAHLHHWNTPPVTTDEKTLTAVPSRAVPLDIMAAKLDTLLETARRRLGRRPTSFRMGRWDLRAGHWALLSAAGVLADASVRPLHARDRLGLRPDHFHAPKTPYLVRAGGRDIYELPLTVTPLLPFLPALVDVDDPGQWERDYVPTGFGHPGSLREAFHLYGALALLPIEHPLWAMKLVTRLAVARGARHISLTWHSTEMMPGGNPRLATARAIDAFLAKIAAYIAWLGQTYALTCRTLGECRDAEWRGTPRPEPGPGDWIAASASR